MSRLLETWDDRLPWEHTSGSVIASEILRGSEETALAVVLAQSSGVPSKIDMKALWAARAGKSADPVLIAVAYIHGSDPRVALLGVTPDAVPVSDVEVSLAERLIEHALTLTSPSGLTAEMRRVLGTLTSGVGAGFRNEGLFATHVLEKQPDRSDWRTLCSRSSPLLTQRGQGLLNALGYVVEPVSDGLLLRDPAGDGVRRAAAVLLAGEESLDNPLSKFNGSTAVAHGLALARREGVGWLIVLGGPVARLFPVDPDIGIGRKGQTQTFAEIDLSLLDDDHSGYLSLLFAPDALADTGHVAMLLAESAKYATGLSERLRDRIYEDVIPSLATTIAEHMRVTRLPKVEQKPALDEAYHRAMIVLFRLLFVAYAEDRGLLPLDVNDAYTSNALKTLGRRILDDLNAGFSATSTSIWTDLTQVWDVIDTGDLEGMGVPPYNGGLFTRDAAKNPSGAAIYDLRVANIQIGPVLRGLLLDTTPDGVLGMVDFRSLDVREFGTIYEGLLESGLGIAETDLTVDGNDTYVPAIDGDEVRVSTGSVYFHSRSGSRKATGSYFTKPFAVQHLLDTALEPAIDDHLVRVAGLLDKGATKSASEALFDFRVADLSMGSAHFLVAAVDRLEARFSAFLIEHPIPDVDAELDALRVVAASQLGLDPIDAGIDNGLLLRRQIARRCIYGVDINEIAVELARLAIWIHTFVPGLPLSFLNHGLIWGNSLTGVGTLDEIPQALNDAEQRETKTSGTGSFFLDEALADFMARAGTQLELLAKITDASVADVSVAAEIQSAIDSALEPLAALCDLLTAERTTRHLKQTDPERILLSAGGGSLFTVSDAPSLERAVLDHPHLDRARKIASEVSAAHLPVRYPEVFRRDRPGFDVILGNPPWEKLKVEVSRWWSLRFPGLRALPQGQQDAQIAVFRTTYKEIAAEYDSDVGSLDAARHVLVAGPYPGIGSGDPDLYQAFAWRFLRLVRQEGRVGVVVPRSLLAEAGSSKWREEAFDIAEFAEVLLLVNSAKWAFEMEPRYTIALLSMVKKSQPDRVVRLGGPFHTLAEFEAGVAASRVMVPADEFRRMGSGAAFPILPDQAEADIYRVFRSHPRLDLDTADSWRARPYAEFHATADKPLFTLDVVGEGHWKLYKGESFNLWKPDTGTYYGSVSPSVLATLEDKRLSTFGRLDSPFTEFSKTVIDDVQSLPILHPRIAFRLVCRATDSRTFITALIPPLTALTHGAPYFLWPRGGEANVAYLLGVLSSIPLDWLARRAVEVNMTYHVVNGFAVPRVDSKTGRLMSPDGSLRPAGWDYTRVRDRIVEIAGRLAAVDDRYLEWAQAIGVRVASVETESERSDLIAELDASVCLLYGLSEEQVGKVFTTFHRGWDFAPRLAAVLVHYRSLMATLTGTGMLP